VIGPRIENPDGTLRPGMFIRAGIAVPTLHGAGVIPHATIGVGIFMAASLHATATLASCPYHEYQHSVFDRNLAHVDTTMVCEAGYYRLPAGPGLGVEPRASLWRYRMDA